jgi:hypothetical protein
MSRIIRHSLQVIKESVIKHVSAVLSVGDGLVPEIALHLDDTQNLFIFNLFKFGFGKFSGFDFFTRLENDGGTFERADMLTTEWRWERTSQLGDTIWGRRYGEMSRTSCCKFVDGSDKMKMCEGVNVRTIGRSVLVVKEFSHSS